MTTCMMTVKGTTSQISVVCGKNKFTRVTSAWTITDKLAKKTSYAF